MSPRGKNQEPKKLPFDERIMASIQSLEELSQTEYDRDSLLLAHAGATEIADEGSNSNEIDQIKAIETKLEVTVTAIDIAKQGGDDVAGATLGHLEQNYRALLGILQSKDKPSEPAQTTQA